MSKKILTDLDLCGNRLLGAKGFEVIEVDANNFGTFTSEYLKTNFLDKGIWPVIKSSLFVPQGYETDGDILYFPENLKIFSDNTIQIIFHSLSTYNYSGSFFIQEIESSRMGITNYLFYAGKNYLKANALPAGLLKIDSYNNTSTAVADTDYATPASVVDAKWTTENNLGTPSSAVTIQAGQSYMAWQVTGSCAITLANSNVPSGKVQEWAFSFYGSSSASISFTPPSGCTIIWGDSLPSSWEAKYYEFSFKRVYNNKIIGYWKAT